ncbi:MAG: ABC transporter substrate-binding protein [Bacillota bacterium]
MITQNTAKNTLGNMLKKGMALTVALVLFAGFAGAILTGCSSRQASFIDGAGRTLELKESPKRIVSLSPAHTEILFALGLGERVVGVSNWCNKPEEALEREKVGDAFNLSKEKLVALKPDIVFIPGTQDSQQVKEVEDLGITVYVSNPASIAEVLEDIQRVAVVAGIEKKGKELVGKMEQELKSLSQDLEIHSGSKPTVLVVLDQELWTVGPGSFMNDVLDRAGGDNMVKDVDMQYLQISMEEVLAKDPDVILVTIPEDQIAGLKSRPGWSDLRAVKDQRVYFVDGDLTSRPGPSIVEGVKEIARHLYPDSTAGE